MLYRSSLIAFSCLLGMASFSGTGETNTPSSAQDRVVASAPDEDRLQAARRLAEAMKLEATVRQQVDLAGAVMLAPASRYVFTRFDKELTAAMQPAFNELRQSIRDQIGIKWVLDDTIARYARTFTVTELNEMAAFYASPLGKRLAAEAPRLQEEGWSETIPDFSRIMFFINDKVGESIDKGMTTALLQRREQAGVVVGRPFPEFKAHCVDGSTFDSSSLKGKAALLICWASPMTGLAETLTRLRAIYDRFHGRGLEVVGFCMDYEDEKDRTKEFLDKHPMPWPNLAVSYGDGLELYHRLVLERPDSFLIGTNGVLLAVNPSLDDLPAMVEKALDGKNIKPAEPSVPTKASGAVSGAQKPPP